jgi:hypothetical protein
MCGRRQRDRELRSLARDGSAGDVAAVRADDPAHECESETESTELSGRGSVALREIVEDRVEPFWRDADAVVGDRQLYDLALPVL